MAHAHVTGLEHERRVHVGFHPCVEMQYSASLTLYAMFMRSASVILRRRSFHNASHSSS